MSRWALASILLLAGIFAGAAPAYAAAANGFEDLDKLEARLVNALDAPVATPGGIATHIDRRMKLQPCPSPVAIDPPAMGAIALHCDAIGWRIRVPLMRLQGASVPSNGAQPVSYMPAAPIAPPTIKRGDPVQLMASNGGFTVSTDAVAQEDGRSGGRIRVKTDPRGPVIIGEVIDNGRVRVSSF
ncbi:MAG: flagellar protein [Sphingomonas bacterium]|jgi:flagella basal body P-ring formation protein FlgA|nr:flagellar protein [Sphingomonas bacterium]